MVNRRYYKGVLGAVGLVAVLFVGLNFSTPTHATSSSASATVHVPDACTLVSTLNTPHTATLSPGTSTGYGNSGGVDGIGQTTLKVTCNDSLGFAIYAIGYTEDTFGNTNLVSNTKNNGTSTYTIATGTNTSGANSNWAMQINAVSGSFAPTIQNSFDASTYHNVPTTYTMVAKRTSATMNPADSSTQNVGSSITTTYAAYISTEQAPDTYTGKVKYTLVHPASEVPLQPQPAVAGYIVYHANASDAIGTMGNQSASDGNDVTLYASNFSRQGYGFAGWNDKYDYTGNFYGPNQDITVPTGTTTNGLSLYAAWIKSAGSLQSNATTACNSLTQAPTPANGTATLASVTALTDERDGNTYAVAKLADNKCWMIENLRLADKDANNNDINLSSTNTHNPSLPLTNSWWYSSANDSDTVPTSNHLSATTNPTTTAWCTSNSSACDDQSMLATNNTTLFTNNTSTNYSSSSNVYSYGNYYNWYSATAGHGKYGDNYNSDYTVPGDICPAGWHLPIGKDSPGEFVSLDVAMGGSGNYQSGDAGAAQSAKWRSYPNNFVYSGSVNGSSANNRGSYGSYWSSSANNYYGAYGVGFESTGIIPAGWSNKYYGKSVRCIAGT